MSYSKKNTYFFPLGSASVSFIKKRMGDGDFTQITFYPLLPSTLPPLHTEEREESFFSFVLRKPSCGLWEFLHGNSHQCFWSAFRCQEWCHRNPWLPLHWLQQVSPADTLSRCLIVVPNGAECKALFVAGMLGKIYFVSSSRLWSSLQNTPLNLALGLIFLILGGGVLDRQGSFCFCSSYPQPHQRFQ